MHTRVEFPPDHLSPASRRRADAERLEAQLAEWTAIIAQCRSSAKRAGADTRPEWDHMADELQRLRNQAGAQVMLLKGSPDHAWEDSVTDLDHAWVRIRSVFHEAESRL